MVFRLSPEQAALRDGVLILLRERFPLEQLPARSMQGVALLDEVERALAELSVAEYFANPDDSTFIDLMLVAEACGFSLAPGHPALTLLSGPYLFSRLSDVERGAVVTLLGEEVVHAVESGAGSMLTAWETGSATAFAYAVSNPQALLTVAKTVTIQSLKDGLADPADGLDLLAPVLSSLPLAQGIAPFASSTVQRYISLQHVLLAAEMAGIAERVVSMTRDYVAGREQFGVPVAVFQGVSHPLADMYARSEALSALARFAAWSADHSPEQLALSARAALRYACDVVPQIVERAIQLHGGIGFTWEFPLHLFLRRAQSITQLHVPSDAELISVGRAQE